MSPGEPSRGISVVVCCYDSADVIRPTVEALAAQELSDDLPFELILVDNNCRDDTVEIARSAWKPEAGSLRVLHEPRPGLIHARRTGLDAVSHDTMVWADDDNVLAPDWLRRAVGILDEHPEVGFLGGRNDATTDGDFPEWFPDFQAVYACGSQAEATGYVTEGSRALFGAGLAGRTRVMRQVFETGPPMQLVGRTGNALLRGEDSEICLRAALMGWKLWYEEALRLEHFLKSSRLTWDYVKRARTGGAAARVILEMYQRLLEGQKPRRLGRIARELRRRVTSCLSAWLRRRGAARTPRDEIEWCVLKGRIRGLMAVGTRYNALRRCLVEAYGGRWLERKAGSSGTAAEKPSAGLG